MSSITTPTSFSANTLIKAADVNTNFTNINSVVNGALDNGNLSASASIVLTKLAAQANKAAVLATDSSTGVIAATAAGTSNQTLVIPNGGGTPTFGQLKLDSTAATTGSLLASRGGTGLDTSGSTTGVPSISTGTWAINTTLPVALGGTGLASSPITVPLGGSGVTSLTPYAVLCGGTTSTGAVQGVSSLGSSGSVLTSNGASALPTMQTLPAATASANGVIPFSNWAAGGSVNWTTNVSGTSTYMWRRVGDSMEVTAYVALTGAPDNATLVYTLPGSHSWDTAKISGVLDNGEGLGSGYIRQSSTGNTYLLISVMDSATQMVLRVIGINADTNVSKTSPITFANGDHIMFRATVPISGWGF